MLNRRKIPPMKKPYNAYLDFSLQRYKTMEISMSFFVSKQPKLPLETMQFLPAELSCSSVFPSLTFDPVKLPISWPITLSSLTRNPSLTLAMARDGRDHKNTLLFLLLGLSFSVLVSSEQVEPKILKPLANSVEDPFPLILSEAAAAAEVLPKLPSPSNPAKIPDKKTQANSANAPENADYLADIEDSELDDYLNLIARKSDRFKRACDPAACTCIPDPNNPGEEICDPGAGAGAGAGPADPPKCVSPDSISDPKCDCINFDKTACKDCPSNEDAMKTKCPDDPKCDPATTPDLCDTCQKCKGHHDAGTCPLKKKPDDKCKGCRGNRKKCLTPECKATPPGAGCPAPDICVTCTSKDCPLPPCSDDGDQSEFIVNATTEATPMVYFQGQLSHDQRCSAYGDAISTIQLGSESVEEKRRKLKGENTINTFGTKICNWAKARLECIPDKPRIATTTAATGSASDPGAATGGSDGRKDGKCKCMRAIGGEDAVWIEGSEPKDSKCYIKAGHGLLSDCDYDVNLPYGEIDETIKVLRTAFQASALCVPNAECSIGYYYTGRRCRCKEGSELKRSDGTCSKGYSFADQNILPALLLAIIIQIAL